ncbi:MAG: LamG domain-containing protein [Candidatus Pacebacteria bacterium]|nr:LamG domain-containing protein [Candidatus Paceibacterota bacterium]MDD5012982.1 LamG domain-containing protein [Candidatus Paceibacterota bacterium]MDD5752610.1 LamG domain-containing protein [Candidatus Paceibacterota bacterium]
MSKSFTLIEILVVIVVIGILSSFIIIGLSSVSDKANIAKGQVFLNSLDNSLLMARVSSWKLDEGTGNTTVDSWGNNTGILGTSTVGDAAEPTWTDDCISNNCLFFDGEDDYVGILHNSDLKPVTAITFGGWAYSTNWESITDERLLSCTESGGYNISFNGDSANRIVAIRRNGAYGFITYSLTSLSNGWHYFLGTYDGRYAKGYIDSIQVGNINDAGAIYDIQYNVNNSLIVGAESGSGINAVGGYFQGKIDDIRIYNQVISSFKIKNNYFIGLNHLFKNNKITLNEFNQRVVELKSNLTQGL